MTNSENLEKEYCPFSKGDIIRRKRTYYHFMILSEDKSERTGYTIGYRIKNLRNGLMDTIRWYEWDDYVIAA